MQGAYLGPEFSVAQIEMDLTKAGAVFVTLSENETIKQTAQLLADGKAVGWFQGRMEYGPRALGGRSILGDPRSPTMQKTLNFKERPRIIQKRNGKNILEFLLQSLTSHLFMQSLALPSFPTLQYLWPFGLAQIR